MPQTVEHIVVLMLENRSFDHMCGYLMQEGMDIDGLTGNETNPTDPQHPAHPIRVSNKAGDVLSPDPGHGLGDVNVQLFNNPSGPPPVGNPNDGFIFSYSQQNHVTPELALNIMKCFAPQNVPVLSALAREFALCDRWYSSVPGPTWPNRFFAHAATSDGQVANNVFHDYAMPTIFENLTAKGLTWRNYFHDFSLTWELSRLGASEFQHNFPVFSVFESDARNGTLPSYSFIEPQYYPFLFSQANDQHPPHSIAHGEELIARVYNAVRNSPLWQRTLLVITYDEHGGTYDHRLPEAATPPDNLTSQFEFNRYGVRVPAILISPYIPRQPVHRVFDHTSIPATLKQVFGLADFLTNRDRIAQPFHTVASLDSPRDTPASVGPPAATQPLASEATRLMPQDVAMARTGAGVSLAQLTDFQHSIVALADRLAARQLGPIATARVARRVDTEYDAALHVREIASALTGRP